MALRCVAMEKFAWCVRGDGESRRGGIHGGYLPAALSADKYVRVAALGLSQPYG